MRLVNHCTPLRAAEKPAAGTGGAPAPLSAERAPAAPTLAAGHPDTRGSRADATYLFAWVSSRAKSRICSETQLKRSSTDKKTWLPLLLPSADTGQAVRRGMRNGGGPFRTYH